MLTKNEAGRLDIRSADAGHRPARPRRCRTAWAGKCRAKFAALTGMAQAILRDKDSIIAANAVDMMNGEEAGCRQRCSTG